MWSVKITVIINSILVTSLQFDQSQYHIQNSNVFQLRRSTFGHKFLQKYKSSNTKGYNAVI